MIKNVDVLLHASELRMIKMVKNGESGDRLAIHFWVKTNEKWFKRTKVVMCRLYNIRLRMKKKNVDVLITYILVGIFFWLSKLKAGMLLILNI